MTYTMPRPTTPSGDPITTEDVQSVWDHYVRPDQEAEVPPSGEMRVLMAILRATYSAYGDTPEGPTMPLPTPLVWPFGWEVDHPGLVGECQDAFLPEDQGPTTTPRHQLALTAILDAVKTAIQGGRQ